jgi:hypothetical protein
MVYLHLEAHLPQKGSEKARKVRPSHPRSDQLGNLRAITFPRAHFGADHAVLAGQSLKMKMYLNRYENDQRLENEKT